MSDITVKDRVKDAVKICELKSQPRFIGFMSPSEVAQVSSLINNVSYMLYGGYDMAERVYLGIFPDWCEKSNALFPITAITFTFRSCDKLTHRDFLGTIMSLGLKRSAIGDIIVESGKATAFVSNDIKDYLLSQIVKVGGVGVTVKEENVQNVQNNASFVECSATVSSNRVDSIVAALVSKGRSKACELISEGVVSVNSKLVSKNTQTIKASDVISIRKYGKFTIISAENITKKGRLIIEWKKYI